MWAIEIEDGLRLRFPGRDAEFAEGVEIGMLAVLMAGGAGAFERRLSAGSIDQARTLARKLGYHLSVGEARDGSVPVRFGTGRARPSLTLITSSISDPDRGRAGLRDDAPARRSAPTLVPRREDARRQ